MGCWIWKIKKGKIPLMKKFKIFRVAHWNLIDITISLSGGNEIENNGCLVKEIQLAYDKIREINILDLCKNREIN